MRLWPFSRPESDEQAPRTPEVTRWAYELDGQGLRFSGQGSLTAPSDLLEHMLSSVSNRRVSRADALKASPVFRARNVIAGVSATLDLELRDRDRELDGRDWVGVQPNPNMEPSVMWSMTFADLLFEGVSYWRVTRFGSDGYPLEAEHVDIRSVAQNAILGMPSQVVSEDHPWSVTDPVFIDGVPYPQREIIRFLSPHPPLLKHAGRAIRTLLLLDQIAADYTANPLPFGYFTDADDIGGQPDEDSLTDDEITGLLHQWERARREHQWGYVPSHLKLNMLEWPTPEQLQLAQARNHAVLEIARFTGLDPEDMGVHLQGSSRTYVNAEQRRLDLVDFTLVPYLKAVEDRLSMNDVTPSTVSAKFRVGGFTRADFKTRMEGYKLARDAEVLTVDEIRQEENRPKRIVEPAPAPTPASVSPNGNGGNGRG